jgi:PPOX class probable F420-dependent enzyme
MEEKLDKLTSTRRDAIEHRLREDLMIWLTTVGPTGRPHTVPVWFWWDGESITIYCEPETKKIRNLRQNPAITFALETRDDGEEVIVFEGDAELVASPTTVEMPAAFGDKYAHLWERISSSPSIMAERYSQPVRLRPKKLITWGVPE